jgi:sodium/proline symporter
MGALSIGWIGLSLFGPGTLEDPEYVMPSVMLHIFPPAIAAVLITGAIAAMISTADSLLILSATELSEGILKNHRADGKDTDRHSLLRSRIITGLLAFVALGVAYLSPSNLIYTLVGYVWAGIGGTFSVVILFSLFWRRFHGMAVLATVVSGMIFTILWISTGMEEVITARFMTFLVAVLVAVGSTLLLPRKRPFTPAVETQGQFRN